MGDFTEYETMDDWIADIRAQMAVENGEADLDDWTIWFLNEKREQLIFEEMNIE